MRKRLVGAAMLGLVLALGSAPGAAAETGEIRIVRQFGLGYLPLHVALDAKLIEQRLKAAGLPDTKVTVLQATSGAAANDYVISGNADFAMGGATVAFTLWDKTKGRANVKAMMPLCDSPMYLTTIEPRIQSIRDFQENDRIAVTAVKITQQALFLQMAAAREFGWDGRFRIDPMTVSLSHPDAVAGMLSGQLEIKSYVATVPFNFQVMANPKVRTITTSFDVLGSPHSSFAIFNAEGFKTKNPKSWKAVAEAFEEAMTLINRDKRAAAEAYLRQESSKMTVDEVYGILQREADIKFTSTPRKTLELAAFMHRLGTLRNLPADWREMFWENVHDRPGS